VDGDSDLPLPHTRDATTLLCSTAYDDNWAESELRTQKKAAPSPWKLRQRLGTATLVTSNLLILAALNVLFPGRASAGRSMDIAIEKMSIAEKLLAIQRLWNSLQQEEIRTPLVWLEHVLNEHLQALHEGQAGFSPLEEVAQRLRRPRA
jgi:hypothetical protein